MRVCLLNGSIRLLQRLIGFVLTKEASGLIMVCAALELVHAICGSDVSLPTRMSV